MRPVFWIVGVPLLLAGAFFAIANREVAKAVLGLPENVEAVALIPVGYPMGKFGPVTRKPVSEIVHFDRC